MSEKINLYNVEPLRTAKEIEDMKNAIRRGDKATPKNQSLADRDVLMFLMGINTGLRVSDLIKLKVGDVKARNTFTILEGKTKKKREINIGMLRDEIDRFTENKSNDEYLFQSRRGDSHISNVQAYRILVSAGEWLGLDYIGTHTMRKTFGYHHYKKYKDVAMLQEIFNHSAPSITKSYIGIRQDEINDTLNNFRLG